MGEIMTRILLLLPLLLLLANPAPADTAEIKPEISKLEFEGIFFGDFPAEGMICTRGLCPVGDMGVGINDNARILPTYTRDKAITHFNRVRISAPEYSFFDNRMFQVFFSVRCEGEELQTCLDEIVRGLDAQYGLTLIEESSSDKDQSFATYFATYATESSSLVTVSVPSGKGRSYPLVKIYDPTLMDEVRLFFNPGYKPDLGLQEKLQELKRQRSAK